MNNAIVVHVFQTDDAARYEELGLVLRKFLALIVVVPEVATRDQVCHQEHVLVVLEGVKHIDEEGVLQLA